MLACLFFVCPFCMFPCEWRWRKRKKRKGGTRYEQPEQKPKYWSTEALKQEIEKGGNARQKNKLIKTITDDEGAIRESSGGQTYCGGRPKGEHKHQSRSIIRCTRGSTHTTLKRTRRRDGARGLCKSLQTSPKKASGHSWVLITPPPGKSKGPQAKRRKHGFLKK